MRVASAMQRPGGSHGFPTPHLCPPVFPTAGFLTVPPCGGEGAALTTLARQSNETTGLGLQSFAFQLREGAASDTVLHVPGSLISTARLVGQCDALLRPAAPAACDAGCAGGLDAVKQAVRKVAGFLAAAMLHLPEAALPSALCPATRSLVAALGPAPGGPRDEEWVLEDAGVAGRTQMVRVRTQVSKPTPA